MAGRITKADKQLRPDPKYNSKQLSRFINTVMQDGKKAVAQRIVYGAFDEIERRTDGKPAAMEVFEKAIENVRPSVEVRSKRVGGANYQVPMQVSRSRQQSLAFRWLIDSCRDEKGRSMYLKLAQELYEASQSEGRAVNIRNQTHRMAEANKAFAHFAW